MPRGEQESTVAPLTTSVVPARRFVREVLNTSHEPPPFVRAVVAFTDAGFYTAKQIGEPEYHAALAARVVGKLGLPEEERMRAARVARELLMDFGLSMSHPDEDEERKERISERAKALKRKFDEERKERISERAEALKRKFTALMQPSDDMLKVKNSNLRMDFRSDPVFPELDKSGKEQFRQRLISELAYHGTILNRLTKANIVVFDAYDIDRAVLSSKIQRMEQKDTTTKQRLGEAQFTKLVAFVYRLTAGEPVDKADIIQAGLPIDLVVTRARRIIISARFDASDAGHADHRLITHPTERATRLQQDPNYYLGDGSNRQGLGYLQGAQELRD